MTRESDNHLLDLFVKPDFDAGRITVSFTPPGPVEAVKWSVHAAKDDRRVAAGEARPKGAAQVSFSAGLPGFRAWSVDAPFLYELRMTVERSGGERIEVARTFGMYKYEARGTRLYVNNEPFLVRGHIRGREAHDHPNLLGLSEYDYYEKNIRATKEYGFNFIRFHSKVPPPAYFLAADRLGVLTHVEVRKYYGKYQKERELMDHDPVLVKPEDWRETVLLLRNHPSLMVYCMGNEINKPGNNPQVKRISEMTRELDPTRLFIDTCARGEYDRAGVDLDVQHMGYFCPFGRNSEMFNTTSNWAIFGSVSGREMVAREGGDPAPAVTRREVGQNRPVVAHEICHYVALRDLDRLEEKFATCGAEKPWWIGELKKLRARKGLDADFDELVRASQRYQFIWWKQCIESARRSPMLSGYHFLQLADTDRYENANGLMDCFDDPKHTSPAEFLVFNGPTALIAELPRRAFFEGEKLSEPLWLSHYGLSHEGAAALEWELSGPGGRLLGGRMADFDLSQKGLRRIATLEMTLPAVERAQLLRLSVRLAPEGQAPVAANAWTLAVFPDRPGEVRPDGLAVRLDGLDVIRRYPQMAPAVGAPPAERLLLASRFTKEVISHLRSGGEVLMLYRVPENRDYSAAREELYLPSTRDRFKGVIWDRGHNLGALVREHPATAGFPSDGLVDFHFQGIVDDCDKVVLDDFPGAPAALVQGIDKASRDRFDVYKFELRELQPEWTMRRFAYLFETRVGRGRLIVCGFNLTGIESRVPEACGMFEHLLRYARSEEFRPAASVTPDELESYLRRKGSSKRVIERMMTQYWQIDAEPLESARYWKESEQRILAEMG